MECFIFLNLYYGFDKYFMKLSFCIAKQRILPMVGSIYTYICNRTVMVAKKEMERRNEFGKFRILFNE